MYDLDTNAARKADAGGQFIKDIGAYVGTFTRAESVVAGTGTKGVAFTFESDGKKANVALYTVKADGTKIMGYDALMAIMTCMEVRNIAPSRGRVKKWDSGAQREVDVEADIFPALMGKQIGLLLETEDYEKKDHSLGTRMVLAGCFQPSTKRLAHEILDKKPEGGEALQKRIAALRHRPMKGAKPAAEPAGHFDDMADDIPF